MQIGIINFSLTRHIFGVVEIIWLLIPELNLGQIKFLPNLSFCAGVVRKAHGASHDHLLPSRGLRLATGSICTPPMKVVVKYLARLRKKLAKRVAGRRRSSSESPGRVVPLAGNPKLFHPPKTIAPFWPPLFHIIVNPPQILEKYKSTLNY